MASCSWGNTLPVPPSSLEAVIALFAKLGTLIEAAVQRHAAEISWLQAICQAVPHFPTTMEADKKIALGFIQYGYRRRSIKFLGSHQTYQPSFFGLSYLRLFAGGEKRREIELGFKCLRKVAHHMSLHHDQVIFRYHEAYDDGWYNEWASMEPPPSNAGGQHCLHSTRWISYITKLRKCCSHNRVHERQHQIFQDGETCEVAIKTAMTPIHTDRQMQEWEWERPPNMFNTKEDSASFRVLENFIHIFGLPFHILIRVNPTESINLRVKYSDLYLHSILTAIQSDPQPDDFMCRLIQDVTHVCLKIIQQVVAATFGLIMNIASRINHGRRAS